MPRLFVGTPLVEDLATQPVLDTLGNGNVKPVDPDLYHVTLAFIGDVADDQVASAQAAVQQGAAGPAHQGVVKSIGAFPSPSRASVLWAGIDESHLAALATSVRSALAKEGLPYDDRDFHAHLTLARLRNKQDVTAVTKRFQGTVFGTLPVDAICLYASTLTPEGPEYEVVERVDLEA